LPSAESYVTSSRGCFPAMTATIVFGVQTAVVSSSSAQTLLGKTAQADAATLGAAVGTITDDVELIFRYFCVTNGLCCYTNLCNSAVKLNLNFIFLLVSIFLGISWF